MIYLDNAATTAPLTEAVNAFTDCVLNYGNPSSKHSAGIAASERLSSARRLIAASLKAKPDEIYFTSGATESNNTAIFGTAKKYGRRKKTIIASSVEHPSVNEPLKLLEKEGFNVIRIFPRNCVFHARDFIDAVNDDTFFVTCMFCNNELGTLLPVGEIFRGVKRKNKQIITHCDLVQGYMKFPVRAQALGADLISVSGHKIHAFKGIGALYMNSSVKLPPYIVGGGQERGFRSGTESLPLISAFTAAVEVLEPTLESRLEHISKLSNKLKNAVCEIDDTFVNSPADSSPYVISISMKGYRSEILLNYLNDQGICVSSGSACSKGKKSSVLAAFGLPDELIDSTLRISLSFQTTESEIDEFILALHRAKTEILTKN